MKLIKTKPGNRPMGVAVTRREKKKVLPWWRPEGVCITSIGDLGWTMMVNKQKLYVTREMNRQSIEHNDNVQATSLSSVVIKEDVRPSWTFENKNVNIS